MDLAECHVTNGYLYELGYNFYEHVRKGTTATHTKTFRELLSTSQSFRDGVKHGAKDSGYVLVMG